MQTPSITVACEGLTDAAVLRRLVLWLGFAAGPQHIKGGKGNLDRRLRSYNAAAKLAPWLVVRDLDSDADCAPTLVKTLLPEPAESMCFRLAVPQIEAWLLADRSGLARFLGVPSHRLPETPDAVSDAKRELVQLAGKSRYRPIREDMVSRDPHATRSVGPGYSARIIEFAEIWQPDRAREASPSLSSCIRSLRRLRDRAVIR